MQKFREIKLCGGVSSKIVFTKFVKYIQRAKNALNDEFSNRELYFNFTNYFLELKIPSILFRCYFACKDLNPTKLLAFFIINFYATFKELQKCGIQSRDPRLEHFMQMLDNLKPNSMSSVEELKLDPQVFRNLLIENIVLVNKVLENSFVIPAFSAFCEQISVIFEKVSKTQNRFAVLPDLHF